MKNSPEYEYEYYSVWKNHPNTNMNIIRFENNDRIWIRIIWYLNIIRIIFEYRIIRSPLKYKYYKYYRAGYLRLFISWCGWFIIECQNAGVHFRENCRKGLLWHRTWHAHRTNGIFVKQQFGENMFSIPFLQQWKGRKPTPVKLDSDWIRATIDMLFNIHTTHTFDK